MIWQSVNSPSSYFMICLSVNSPSSYFIIWLSVNSPCSYFMIWQSVNSPHSYFMIWQSVYSPSSYFMIWHSVNSPSSYFMIWQSVNSPSSYFMMWQIFNSPCSYFMIWQSKNFNSIEVSPIFQHNYWLSMTGHWQEWAGCSPLPGLELTLIALQLWRWAHCQWAVRWSSKYHAAGDRVTPIPLKHHRRITSPCQNVACRQYVFVLDLSLNQGLLKAALY